MRNRWYDAGLGRFLSRDPLGTRGGLNLYAYVNNNPVNSVDPMGLQGDGSGDIPPGPYRDWLASRPVQPGYGSDAMGNVLDTYQYAVQLHMWKSSMPGYRATKKPLPAPWEDLLYLFTPMDSGCGDYSNELQTALKNIPAEYRRGIEIDTVDVSTDMFLKMHQAVVVHRAGQPASSGFVLDPWINSRPDVYTWSEWVKAAEVTGIRNSPDIIPGVTPVIRGRP